MRRAVFQVGEQVEVRCDHLREGELVNDWLGGQVVAADFRMVAVRLAWPVFTGDGRLAADRVLWCAHGSPRIRRPGEAKEQRSA